MSVGRYVVAAEGVVHRWLVRRSISILRVALGLVFLAFGALKYVPGASPAEDLAVDTTRILTLGIVPDSAALVLVATLECAIGLSLILDRGLRVTIYLLALELLGVLSPLVLLPERLFPAPWHTPTLEGQYVLKDIVLVGAVMVVATTFRGARITLAAHTPGSAGTPAPRPASQASAQHRARELTPTRAH